MLYSGDNSTCRDKKRARSSSNHHSSRGSPFKLSDDLWNYGILKTKYSRLGTAELFLGIERFWGPILMHSCVWCSSVHGNPLNVK